MSRRNLFIPQAFDVYKAADGVEARTTNIAIIGAFSGMAAVYVLIGMALGLVISCSVSTFLWD